MRHPFVITGANSGIGFETARQLVAAGHGVVLACRDRLRGEAARRHILDEFPEGAVEVLDCDLLSLASTRQCAWELLSRHKRLSGLILNAASFPSRRRLSPEGVEEMLAIGALGHFALTLGLLPALGQGSRIVTLVGLSHRSGRLNLDDPGFVDRPWNQGKANAQAQLAKLMMTFELSARLAGRGVTANAVHPGAVLTPAIAGAPWWARILAPSVARPILRTPSSGAEPVTWLATAPELAGVTRRFFNRFHEAPYAPAADDDLARRRLWDWGHRMADSQRSAA